MNISGSYSNNNINNRLSASFNLQHPFLYSAEEIDLQKLEHFLKSGDENCCIIRLWIPKIVQRSYGREKRFFCPPPCIALLGNGWNTNKNEMISNLARLRMQLQDAYRMPGITIQEQNRIKGLLNQVPNLPLRINLNVGINDGTVPFVSSIGEREIMIKTLFINSVDRRRYFKLSCDLTDCIGPSVVYPARFIGNFESTEIRVVSKPPKKQTVRAVDSAYISLKSGMQVALFNRTRSEGVAPRFLYVDDPIFIASLEHWSSFYIYADTDESPDSGKRFCIREGLICYNQVVRLVDVLTGISSPNLILRRVEKNVIEVAPQEMDEPVAMLQRVAFQLSNTESTYLALAKSNIVQKTTKIIRHDAHGLDDSIAWSITNCEMIEYKYFEIMGPTVEPVAPVPFIQRAELETVQPLNAVIEFCGINLGHHLNVYFGIFKSTRLSANVNYMRCIVPTLAQVTQISSEDGVIKPVENGGYQVPISLVRNDGVVYPIDMLFQYNSYPFGGIGKIVFRTPFTPQIGGNEEYAEEGDKRLETTLTDDEGVAEEEEIAEEVEIAEKEE